MKVVQTFDCPTCGREYRSSVRLTDSPICSGAVRDHKPVDMVEAVWLCPDCQQPRDDGGRCVACRVILTI